MYSNYSPFFQMLASIMLQCEAIIVKVYPYSESSIIARAISPSLGKVGLIARHARNSKKRFPSSIDVFDRGTFELGTAQRGLIPVNSFSPSRTLRTLREDLDKLALAELICESFDALVQEEGGQHESRDEVGHGLGQANIESIYELLRLGLESVDEAPDTTHAMRGTFLCLRSLLQLSGFVDAEQLGEPSAKHFLKLLSLLETNSGLNLRAKEVIVARIQGMLGATSAAGRA